MIFTKFRYNDKEYVIFFDGYHTEDYSLKNFEYILRGKKLLLEYLRNDEIKELFNEETSGNVLYLNEDLNSL